MNKLAVMSLSGGVDSTSLLLHLLSNKYKVFAVSFDYGQKHKIELVKAQVNITYLNSKGMNITYKTVDLSSCSSLLSSSLTDATIKIPNGYYEEENMISTVVPNRNAIFLSILYGWALSISKEHNSEIICSLGVHSGDHAIYPDCRMEFYNKIIKSFEIGNWKSDKISIYLPYIKVDKSEILKNALSSTSLLKLDFDTIFKNTITSYNPDEDGISDGKTGSDIERILAFDKIGRVDPLKYKSSWNEVLKFAKKTESNFIRNESSQD